MVAGTRTDRVSVFCRRNAYRGAGDQRVLDRRRPTRPDGAARAYVFLVYLCVAWAAEGIHYLSELLHCFSACRACTFEQNLYRPIPD